MTSSKQKHLPFSKLKPANLKAILIASILINIGILIVIPHHFSFISLFILVPSLIAFRLKDKQMKTRNIRFGVFMGLAFSVIYATLAYYWISKGQYGCAAFFGERNPCFSLESLQYTMLEVYAAPVVLLLVSRPLLKDKLFFNRFRF